MNGGFLSNPGLYTGEMGLILFFTHYARFTQNELYSDYADDLIEKMQNRIYLNTPINYKQGLTGIGATIEYLVQNSFIEGDTDEILEDFDKRIFFTYNLPNLPIDIIMDIGYYTIWRMSGNSLQKNMMRSTILPLILKTMRAQNMNDAISFEKIVSEPDHLIIPEWNKLIQKIIPNGYWEQKNIYFSEQIANGELFDKSNIPLGLQNGLAGCGISLLTSLNGDDSWISLLPNSFYIINNESISF